MKSQTFILTTDLFEVATPGSDVLNPRWFGEDFANWLIPRLRQPNLHTSDPLQEDWGWLLKVDYQGWRFILTIGVMEDSIGKIPAEWQISVGYERMGNKFGNWLRPAPERELSELIDIIQEILGSDQHIQNLKATRKP